MNQLFKPLPTDDTEAEIRYRYSIRYGMLGQIAEFRELKVPACFPWARFLLRSQINSRLIALDGLAGEW
ncbi:Uncharacterised protein [Burkholderia oklahomensis]|uniref:hypothetical protein n=1 Tax=Burkholderia oklahomensis TaxID=342113 RepID=UPI000E161CFD|nr:hypothetical protein [Burkholderia oklahomensis]SUW59065.1 Uncharacterised protein [Burkholderia oklahomensis]